MTASLRVLLRVSLIIVGLFFLPVGCMVAVHYSGADTDLSWWQLRRDSSMQAPDPTIEEAIIQVYAARAARWRGAFGVHTWIATKRVHEQAYTRMEVNGYAVYWGGNAVRVRRGSPDAYWYGNAPTLLRELRGGAAVDAMIDRLEAAAENYRYDRTYRVWPGPNSNTFIAHLARQVPELKLDLPPNAIGKDFLPDGGVVALTPSGTGAQLSLGGYAGIMLAAEEGLEINVLGLTAGLDAWPPAIKLPGVGRIGFGDFRRIRWHTPTISTCHPTTVNPCFTGR